MSLSAAQLEALVTELQPWVGAAAQKAWAVGPHTLCLSLRRPGETGLLVISVAPGAARVHLASARPRGEVGPLQEALRAHLVGGVVTELCQPGGDRVLKISLRGAGYPTLVAELFGRKGALLLLDAEGQIRARGLASPTASERHQLGIPYLPPAAPARRPEGREEAAPLAGGEGAWPLSAAIEAHYAPQLEAQALEGGRRPLLRGLKAALARRRRAIQRVEADAAKVGEADSHQRRGELIKGSLGQLRRGDPVARVQDWYAEGAPLVEIPLEPALSPTENMERYFHRARRWRQAAARVEARWAQLVEELEQLEALAAALEGCGSLSELDALRAAAAGLGVKPQVRGERPVAAERRPYRSFKSQSGGAIWVGRGAKDNHALTFQVARGNDHWLHARGYPGSHVVIPTPGGGAPDEATLLDAAHLAVHFSKAQGEALVEVTLTQRKHLRHPKGAPLGQVVFSSERNLLVRVEAERLARLLEAEGRG